MTELEDITTITTLSNNFKVKANEIRIGMIGNVDSGKSTLTGVLSANVLDDGRGLARNQVLKHQHEQETGRTSSITQNYVRELKLISKSNQKDTILDNFDELSILVDKSNNIKKEYKDGILKEKTTIFVDLAGHEKYLKTTIKGINRCFIDYACVLVGSNKGLQSKDGSMNMSMEHLNISISLKIPTFIVMSKIDITPKEVYDYNLNKLIKTLEKKTRGKRTPIVILNENDLQIVRNSFADGDYTTYIPIFPMSSVTAEGLPILKNFVNNLPCYNNFEYFKNEVPDFIVSSRYNIPGIGTVVAGFMRSGTIYKGDTLQLGPYNKHFYTIQIKSIHNNFSENVNKLEAGQSGSFNIKLNTKTKLKVKSGLHITLNKDLYCKFDANVIILQHPTTIFPNYEALIHCGSISQVAKITDIKTTNGDKCLRLGDRAKVSFEFKQHPEFIQPNTRMVFREGRAKGIGEIIKVYN
jgi:GTPase